MFRRIVTAATAVLIATAGVAAVGAQPSMADPVKPSATTKVTPPSYSPDSVLNKGGTLKTTPSTKKIDPIVHPVEGKAASGTAAKALVAGPPYYWYATGRQTNTTPTFNNASARMSVNNPWADASGYDHSIAEIAVIREGGAGARQIIEIGWGTNIHADGDLQTRFWAGYWKDSVYSGYNPSTFVPYSGGSPCGTLNSVLVPYDSNGDWTGANGTARTFQIVHDAAAGGWWLACGGAWVGYFPDSIWSTASGGAFTYADHVAFFGEVASQSYDPTCTDMGEDGVSTPTSTVGAFFDNVKINGSNANLTLSETDAALYDTAWTATPPLTYKFRYGGDSSC